MDAQLNGECGECVFFSLGVSEDDARKLTAYEFDPKRHGECRRFPPVRNSRELGSFPIVDKENGCGEFR